MVAAIKPANQAEQTGVDAKGIVERHLAYFTDAKTTRSAWLHYMNLRGEYPDAYLKHFHSKKMYVENDTYWIPLGKVNAVPREQEVKQAELDLLPVFPVLFQQHKGHDLVHIESGYLYIYVDGHLWREIKCDSLGYIFREINLALHQGKNERPVGAQSEQYFVLLPQRMNNQPCKVEVAFSEVQWSWDYIVRMGGMADTDPRYFTGAELEKDGELTTLGEYDSKIKRDDELRAKRFQTVDVTGYQPTNQDPGAVDASYLMPVQVADRLNNRPTMQDGYDSPRLEHLTSDIVNTDLPVLALKHPIKFARDLAAAHIMARAMLELLVEEMSGTIRPSDEEYINNQPDWRKHRERQAAEYDLAVFMNQYFYQSVETAKENISSLSKEARKVISERETARNEYLNQDEFKKFLHVDDITIIIKLVNDTKQALIDYLKIENDIHCFTYAAYDFFTLNGKDYIKGFELINDLLAGIKDHPANQVQLLRQELDEWASYEEKDEGQDFLLTLLGVHPDKPAHKLCECLFPQQQGGDWDDLLAYDTGKITEKAAVKFNGEKFLNLNNPKLYRGQDDEQSFRRAALLINSFMTRLAEASFDRSELAKDDYGQKRTSASANYKVASYNFDQSDKALGDAIAERDNAIKVKQQAETKAAQAKVDLEQAKNKVNASAADIAEKQRYYAALQATLADLNANVQTSNHKVNNAYKVQGEQLTKLKQSQADLRELGVMQPHKSLALSGPARFHHAKGNYMLPVFRWHHVAKILPLTQIKLSLADYFAGRYPKGTAPLNIALRQANAEKILTELKRYAETKSLKTFVNRPGQTGVQVLLDDLLHMRSHLVPLLNMVPDNPKAKKAGKTATNEMIRVLAFQLDEAGTMVDDAKQTHQAANASKQTVSTAANTASNNSTAANIFRAFWEDEVARKQGKLEQYQQLKEKFIGIIDDCERILKHPVPDMLNSKGKTAVAANVTITGAALWFELNNLRTAWAYFSHDKNMKTSINLFSAGLDSTAVIAGAADTIVTYKYGRLTTKQLKYLKEQKRLFKTGKITALSAKAKSINFRTKVLKGALRASVIANILSAGIIAYDLGKAMRRQDTHAIIGNGLMLTGFTAMAVNDGISLWALARGSIKNPLGRAGWIGFALVLGGVAYLYLTAKTALENWLNYCPWGKHAYRGDEHRSWFDHPEYAYLDLLNILLQPVVTIEQKSAPSTAISQANSERDKQWQQRIEVTVQLPGYALGSGYLAIRLEVKGTHDQDYKAIDLLSEKDLQDMHNKTSTAKVWQHAEVSLLEGEQGYKLGFPLESFRAFLTPDRYFQNSMQIRASLSLRVSLQMHPNGQNARLTHARHIKYRLPITARDEQGNLLNDNPDVKERLDGGAISASPRHDQIELDLYRIASETFTYLLTRKYTDTLKTPPTTQRQDETLLTTT